MKNIQNPILNFRSKSKGGIKVSESNYNLKLGGRVNSKNKFLVETKQYKQLHLSTLITETREAVDSSENS